MFFHSSVDRKHAKVHCAMGNPSLFPRNSCAKETQRIGIENTVGKREQVFQYCYKSESFRLKECSHLFSAEDYRSI